MEADAGEFIWRGMVVRDQSPTDYTPLLAIDELNDKIYEEELAETRGESSFRGSLTRFHRTPSPPSTARRSKRLSTVQKSLLHYAKTTSNGRSSSKRRAEGADGVGSASTPPSVKRNRSSGYVPPSRYAHLPYLADVLAPNLICVFVGLNPGVTTASSGHAYAHPSNLFWRLLHSSGCTDRRLSPTEDRDLPQLYSMGNTNIVERPTSNQAELSRKEMVEGTPVLEEKLRRYKPEAVVLVGKGIWEAVWKWKFQRNITKQEFKYGWQDESLNLGREAGRDGWKGSRVFVATSTSGLAAGLRPHEKEAIWKPLGDWVKQKRKDRAKAEAVPESEA